MSKKEDRDKVKSYDSLVDIINSIGYNVSGDIETFILDELKRLRECKERYELIVRKVEKRWMMRNQSTTTTLKRDSQ